ncbi:MAG: LacI family DNA-binding transcriptional regulator [Ideonella sp.]
MRQSAAPPSDRVEPFRPGRSASLADVASLAGVSTGTVSRALTRPTMISQATRERVLAAAERLGYVANGAARALAMRRTMTVGAVVPRFGTSSFPTMIQALESTLAAEGYTLLLAAPEHHNIHEGTILRALLERGVDAVALLGSEHPPEVFGLLATHRTPYVMMWSAPSNAGPSVGFDESAAAAMLIEHLAGLQHREIGFIGGRTTDNERALRRLQGLTQAIARRGLLLCEEALIETEYGFREGFEAMTEILNRRTRVSAVVCGNDYLAAGALSALDRANVAVPGQISIASFNDNDFAPFLHPPLSTVRLPIREMGERAGAYLLAKIQNNQPPAPELLAVELIVRCSTGPCPVKASLAAGKRPRR